VTGHKFLDVKKTLFLPKLYCCRYQNEIGNVLYRISHACYSAIYIYFYVYLIIMQKSEIMIGKIFVQKLYTDLFRHEDMQHTT